MKNLKNLFSDIYWFYKKYNAVLLQLFLKLFFILKNVLSAIYKNL